MTDDEKVVSWRCGTVFGRIDFLVGSVYTNAQNFDQHTTAVRNLVNRGLGQISHMDAVGFSWEYTDGFHCISPLEI